MQRKPVEFGEGWYSLASKPGLSALSTFAEAIRPKRPLSQASANAGPSIPILAPLPEGIDGHFDPELRRFVLMQYHQGQSTLPRLGDFLRSVGMASSIASYGACSRTTRKPR